MLHRGGCHCGALRYTLDTALPVAQLPLRACQCAFCRRHGALSTSDPRGRVTFALSEPDLVRYRFGLRTADFLVCARCGVYVGATMTEGDQAWAIVNANTLDDVAALGQAVTPMRYDDEDEPARRARRRSRWSPVADPARGGA